MDYASVFYEKGKEYDKLGDTENAIKYYRKAISCDANMYDALISLVKIYIEYGEYTDALRLLDMMSVKFPEKGEVDYTKGLIYAFIGNDNLAEENFIVAIKKEKDNISFHLTLAEYYYLQEKYEKSRNIYKRILKIDAFNEEALLGMARIYRMRKDYEEAIRYYKMVLDMNPQIVEARMGINNIMMLKEGQKG